MNGTAVLERQDLIAQEYASGMALLSGLRKVRFLIGTSLALTLSLFLAHCGSFQKIIATYFINAGLTNSRLISPHKFRPCRQTLRG